MKKRDYAKSDKAYRERHPGRAAEQVRRYRAKCRFEVIKHYSNGEMRCACCGESHYEFLGVDHINGGGSAMRKALGHGNITRWLYARGFPEGYRILCHNCNMSIGFYGYCPHEKETKMEKPKLLSDEEIMESIIDWEMLPKHEHTHFNLARAISQATVDKGEK